MYIALDFNFKEKSSSIFLSDSKGSFLVPPQLDVEIFDIKFKFLK